MGCINSRTDDQPNVFQVINIDDDGNFISPGRLEVTEIDIILHQNGKQPIKWPLRCLRRYGYDLEGLFSFEAGRRCSTGPGIYAFKCERAEDLFNLVQIKTKLQIREENALSGDGLAESHPAVTRVTIPLEPSYLDPTHSNRTSSRFTHNQQNGRVNSIGSSSGLLSPQGTSLSPSSMFLPPLPSVSHSSSLYANEEVLSSVSMEMERNNNKSLRRATQRSLQSGIMIDATSSNGLEEVESVVAQRNTDGTSNNPNGNPQMAAYMNVDTCNENSLISPSSPEATQLKEENNAELAHLYINVNLGQKQLENATVKTCPPPLFVMNVEEGSRHCYANLEASEIESLRKRFSGVSVSEKSPVLAPPTPTCCPNREMNYAVLDLDSPIDALDNTVGSAPSSPKSQNKPQKGYATIDFNKTAALLHSVNPNLVNDNEGSRKTRHNSTINDLEALTADTIHQ